MMWQVQKAVDFLEGVPEAALIEPLHAALADPDHTVPPAHDLVVVSFAHSHAHTMVPLLAGSIAENLARVADPACTDARNAFIIL